jgi:hypothetical protein
MDINDQQNLQADVASALGINTEPTTPTAPAPEVQDPVTPPAQEPSTDNPVRLLRQQYESTKSELDQNKALLQRIADSKGVTIEQLQESLQAEEDKRNAQTNNIPLEIQQRMRTQEEQIKNLQMQNLRADFDTRANKLKAQYTLDDNQIVDFAEKAKASGFNIFTPGLDLVMLYRAMNYDTVVNDLRNSIRQEILTELQGNNTNTINNIPGTQQPSTNPASELSEKDFMRSLFSNLGR